MKKSVLICVILIIISNFNANAEIGDIVSEIYTTDILTYVDDVPIKGYSINGKTMICLEDLSNYGFTVMYDDFIRTLFVTKNSAVPIGFNPHFERGTIGEKCGYVLDTDIKAVVNGKYANAYSIDGKMAVAVEDLGTYKEVAKTPENDRPIFNCKMSFKYDNSARKLWLYTTENSVSDKTYEYWKNEVNNSDLFNVVLTEDYAVHYYCTNYRLKPTATLSAYISYKNGASSVNLITAFERYGIKTDNVTTVYGDNSKLISPYFKIGNTKNELIVYISENQIYRLNPYTMNITPL